MPGWALPAAAFLGSLFASRGNGGSEFSPEQRRLFGTQADLAEMMKDLYASRIANEERYMGGALDRVFGYVDDSLGRAPDLLHAPGIFEFMPKTGGQVAMDRPAWTPYAPGAKEIPVETPPPMEPPPGIDLDVEGWKSLADLNPVTEIVPPIDLGAVQSLMSSTMGKVWDTARGVVGSLADTILGSVGTDWESWSDEEIWENLWEGEGKPGTSWKDWLGLEGKSTAEALSGLEELMRNTLQLDEKGEAFRQPFQGIYDSKQWMSIPPNQRVISTTELTPRGEYAGPQEDYIDPATMEITGPVVPGGGEGATYGSGLPDLPFNTADPQLWATYGGLEQLTGLVPGVLGSRAWADQRDQEKIQDEVERREFYPYGGPYTDYEDPAVGTEGGLHRETAYPIRPVSGQDVQILMEWAMHGPGKEGGLSFVLEDGSTATGEQIMAYMAGEGEQLYLRDIWTGAMDSSYLPGTNQEELYEGQYRLTAEDIDALLGAEEPQTVSQKFQEERGGPETFRVKPVVGAEEPVGEPLGKVASMADLIWSAWNTTSADPNFLPEADLNADGIINALDLGFLEEQNNQVAAVAEKTPARPGRVRR